MPRKKGKSISFDAMVKFFMHAYDIPTKRDVDKLLARLDRIEALIAAGNGRFRGIRHGVTWDTGNAAKFGRRQPPRHQVPHFPFALPHPIHREQRARQQGLALPLGQIELDLKEKLPERGSDYTFSFELDLVSRKSGLAHDSILGQGVTVRLARRARNGRAG